MPLKVNLQKLQKSQATSQNYTFFINCKVSVFFVSLSFIHKELASLGLDRLKQALQALGLKCGGWVLKLSMC